MAQQLHERLLDDVFGVFAVACQDGGEPVDGRPLGLEQVPRRL
jgi:hypothetical protein